MMDMRNYMTPLSVGAHIKHVQHFIDTTSQEKQATREPPRNLRYLVQFILTQDSTMMSFQPSV
jgi:hypothetical protein